MSDFNSDFNLGEAPQMEQAKASEMQKTLTVQEEYQQYPLNDAGKQQIEAFADKIDLYDSQTVLQYHRAQSRLPIFPNRRWIM